MLCHLQCRRCYSGHLKRLAVIHPQDNPVYRCLDCGFLFSPGQAQPQDPASSRGG